MAGAALACRRRWDYRGSPHTPEAFVGFLQSVADAPNLRDVVVINSPGGRVVASMRLGAALRKLHAAVIVARFGDESDDLNSPSGGQCSEIFQALKSNLRKSELMDAAARRVVPPASRLGIHRMSSQESAGAGRFFAPAAPSYASADMVDALAGYAAQMGVSPTIDPQSPGTVPVPRNSYHQPPPRLQKATPGVLMWHFRLKKFQEYRTLRA